LRFDIGLMVAQAPRSSRLCRKASLSPGSGFAGPRTGSGAVAQEDLAGLHLVQHVPGAAAVVCLPLGLVEEVRQPRPNMLGRPAAMIA
jgi:hypothetical protein